MIIKNNMKKLLLTMLLAVGLTSSSHAGLIVSNLLAYTNLLRTSPQRVYQIDVMSTVANTVTFYDIDNISLTNIVEAYTRVTNMQVSITNLTTNGIFEYPGVSTQIMRQTNIYVLGNARSNITVARSTNQVPVSLVIFCPAGTLTSIPALDINFVRGIAAVATNTATTIIYTRD